jgi:N-acetylmuramoyl-L-alanine amidase
MSSRNEGFWHTVDHGDCLSLLGREHRIPWKKIWEHPDNEPLRKKRGNPNILHPGDKVFIPPRDERIETCATEKKHRFKAPGSTWLRIAILDIDHKPVSGIAFTYIFDGAKRPPGKTDANGIAESILPHGVRDVKLRLPWGEFPVDVGDLAPANTIRGIQQRLRNLGIDPGPIDGIFGPLTARAITRFQSAEKLDVNGQATRQLVKALRDVHERETLSEIERLGNEAPNKPDMARTDAAVLSEDEVAFIPVYDHPPQHDGDDDDDEFFNPSTSEARGQIARLDVRCAHRAKPLTGRVQLVPTARDARKDSYKHPLGWSGELSFRRGGSDSVRVAVQTVGDVGRRQVAIVREGATPVDADWKTVKGKDLVIPVPEHAHEGRWINATPEVWTVYGRGDGTSALSIDVENFAAIEASLTASIPKDDPSSTLRSIIQSATSSSLASSCGPFRLKAPTFSHSGKVSAQWKIEEAEDARAKISFSVSVTMDFAIVLEGTVDLVAIAGMYFAIPPAITAMGTRWLAEIEAFLALKLGLTAKGADTKISRYVDEGWTAQTAGGLLASGEVTIGVRVIAGKNKEVIQATVSAGGRSGIQGEIGLTCKSSGVFASGKADWSRLDLFVEIKFEGFFGERERAYEWKALHEPVPLWQSKDFELLSFEGKGA